MSQLKKFMKQLIQEAVTTRKMLSRIPEDKYNWKPHPKSMALIQLVTHLAELPSWVSMVLNTSELDFQINPYTPFPIANNKELLAYFEKNQAEGELELDKAKEEELDLIWTLKSGDQVFLNESKEEVIRTSISQIIHHRAQLGVFLRLLDIPIPGSYGPSADDVSM